MKLQGNQLSQVHRAVLVSVAVGGVLNPWCVGPWCVGPSVASPWEGLPEETVVAVRIPNGQAAAEAIVSDTKFGAVMFGEKKKAAVVKALESGGSGEWSNFLEQLDDYDLTTGDLIGLFTGESGYAVVPPTIGVRAGERAGERIDAEQEPRLVGLAWFEPGEQRAIRINGAIAQLVDEQDEEQPITRVDLTLAGQPVMQLQVPSIRIEHENEFDAGEEYDDLPAGEKRAAWGEAYRQWQESAVETVVYSTVLVCKVGDRLLIAHDYQDQDEAAFATATEQLSTLFAQWIVAQDSGVEGIVTQLAEDPGTTRVMALEGLPMFELLGDGRRLIGLLRSVAPTEEMAEQIVRILGFDGLGPFAIRSTLHGTRWSTDVSVAAPAPRRGLLQLLDQEPLAIDPPQWVPSSAVRYDSWSLDLGMAYEIIKAEVLREFPNQAAGGVAMVEAYVQNFAQASLRDVFSSLGNCHTIMSFGLESGEAGPISDGDNNGEDENGSPTTSERMACVWQVEDEVLWGRLLKAIAPFAGMAPGVESAEEQGFSGWRMKSRALEGGLFLGRGYLVFGFGSGVIESMLSSLSNPPAGTDAFRGSEVFAAADLLIELKPALAVEITDGNRYMSMMIDELGKQLKQLSTFLAKVDGDSGDAEDGSEMILPLLRALLPSQDEVEGMMGVMVSRWEVNDDGVFGESVQEMPAP